MTFQEASDKLMDAGMTLSEIAAAVGVAYVTARAYRLDPESANARTPPDGWESRLANLARSRAGALLNLADRLEGFG